MPDSIPKWVIIYGDASVLKTFVTWELANMYATCYGWPGWLWCAGRPAGKGE